MARKKPLTYRELLAILKRYGISENKRRGKGADRMLVGVVEGRVVHYPTKCHGEGDEKPVPVINAIRRAFKLTKPDGISDAEFYGK
jgi:hypothetical protein